MRDPCDTPVDGTEKPEDHVGKVDPDRIFHALTASIPLRILVNPHFAEDAEDSHPENATKTIRFDYFHSALTTHKITISQGHKR